MCDLPSDVHLETGKLVVTFETAEQLLSHLYELSQAVANDFDTFCERAGAIESALPLPRLG
jgi:hypothetical protein